MGIHGLSSWYDRLPNADNPRIEKSLCGKTFERFVLGSLLQILGFEFADSGKPANFKMNSGCHPQEIEKAMQLRLSVQAKERDLILASLGVETQKSPSTKSLGSLVKLILDDQHGLWLL
ncbi:MAG: hypothetical protein M9965_06530 [Anaerolineae bacterium]|nr:hypothetical protein [Anaerolineae bacterium]